LVYDKNFAHERKISTGFTCLLLLILAFSNCKDINADGDSSSDINADTVNSTVYSKQVPKAPQPPDLPLLDTTITLKGLKDVNVNKSNLSQEEANRVLNQYYRKQGVLNRTDFKVSPENDADNMCADLDTIHNIHFDNFSGAVISYWLGPCDLNGHCFQPTYAIITQTKTGYTVTNIGFIPENFYVDSVAGSYVYGGDYDCGGRGVIRRYKAKLIR
jgi:hypothetical protein